MFRVIVRLFCLALLAVAFGCRLLNIGGSYHLRDAEEHLRKNEYDQAIAAYRAHIDARLAVKNRPQWENPFFYYLLIGDIELGRDHVAEALSAYREAEKNQIHHDLISDRYRYVARWYEERGQSHEAIEILKQNRELDPLLFEAILDRISKQIINSGSIATPTAEGRSLSKDRRRSQNPLGD